MPCSYQDLAFSDLRSGQWAREKGFGDSHQGNQLQQRIFKKFHGMEPADRVHGLDRSILKAINLPCLL